MTLPGITEIEPTFQCMAEDGIYGGNSGIMGKQVSRDDMMRACFNGAKVGGLVGILIATLKSLPPQNP